MIEILKNRFGFYLKKCDRTYSPFFEYHNYRSITGHKMIEFYFGRYKLILIYK